MAQYAMTDSINTQSIWIIVFIIAGFLTVFLGLLAIKWIQKDRGNGIHSGSRPSFNDKGDRILISINYPKKHKGQLYLVDLTGNIGEPVWSDSYNNQMPAFSKDNSKIVYTQSDDIEKIGSSIWIYDRVQKISRQIIDNQYLNQMPSFAMDGEKIAYQRAKRLTNGHMGGKTWYDRDVSLFDFQTNKIFSIFEKDCSWAGFPRFQDNNQSLYFLTVDQTNRCLFKFNLETNKLQKYFEQEIYSFLITSEGDQLIYTKVDNDVVSMANAKLVTDTVFFFKDLKTRKERIVCVPLQGVVAFDVSPDRKKMILMVSSKRYGEYKLYLLEILEKRLTHIVLKHRGKSVRD